MATQIILLERVDNLGEMGDVVSVKPGYARNFLLPQKKALRASKSNVAYFEAQKKQLEAANEKGKKDAEATAKKLDGLKVPLIRQASEAGQLFGSVTSRDIAQEVSTGSKIEIDRSQVVMNQNFKTLGLFDVDITLHPEVKVAVTINIARSAEEAEIQAKTGKALVSDDHAEEPEAPAPEAADEEQLKDVLEEGALEAEKEKQADAEEKAKAEEEAKAAKEQAALEAKEAAEAEAADAEAAEADESSEEKAEAEEAPAEAEEEKSE